MMRELFLILHFVGLAMALGTSFALIYLGMISEKMEVDAAKSFRSKMVELRRVGQVGLLLLIVSGVYLILPYWGSVLEMPLLIFKLVLVLVLVAMMWIVDAAVSQAKKQQNPSIMKKVKPLGRAALVVALTIVVLAVYIFH